MDDFRNTLPPDEEEPSVGSAPRRRRRSLQTENNMPEQNDMPVYTPVPDVTAFNGGDPSNTEDDSDMKVMNRADAREYTPDTLDSTMPPPVYQFSDNMPRANPVPQYRDEYVDVDENDDDEKPLLPKVLLVTLIAVIVLGVALYFLPDMGAAAPIQKAIRGAVNSVVGKPAESETKPEAPAAPAYIDPVIAFALDRTAAFAGETISFKVTTSAAVEALRIYSADGERLNAAFTLLGVSNDGYSKAWQGDLTMDTAYQGNIYLYFKNASGRWSQSDASGDILVLMPTAVPTALPTVPPTNLPTLPPTAVPTPIPTAVPTAEPTAVPTVEPTAVPTVEPTAVPTVEPTAVPTAEPTAVPTVEPTAVPTAEPTQEPAPTPGVQTAGELFNSFKNLLSATAAPDETPPDNEPDELIDDEEPGYDPDWEDDFPDEDIPDWEDPLLYDRDGDDPYIPDWEDPLLYDRDGDEDDDPLLDELNVPVWDTSFSTKTQEVTPEPTVEPTPVPTPVPTPRPTAEPVIVYTPVPTKAPVLEIGGEMGLKTTDTVYIGVKEQKTYTRAESIIAESPDEYTYYNNGLFTFRGDNFRRNGAFGTADIKEESMTTLWTYPLGSLATKNDGTLYGVGWGTQPAVINWPRQTRQGMNIKDEFKDTILREVIFGAQDGKVYFLDLKTGQATREAINIGYPLRGSVAVDTLSRPVMAVGQAISVMKTKTGPIGLHVFDLLTCKELFLISGRADSKTQVQYGSNGAVDGTPLFVGLSDGNERSMVFAGENGLLYTVKMNTYFAYPEDENNSIDYSLNVTRDITYLRTKTSGYDTNAYTKNVAVESSVAMYDRFVFMVDAYGAMRCVDTDTMKTVWVADMGDNTDASVALDQPDDATLALYTGTTSWTRTGNKKNTVIRRLDAVTGREVWQYSVSCVYDKDQLSGCKASPVIGQYGIDDLVIFTVNQIKNAKGKSAGSRVIALDKESGAEVWSFDMTAETVSSPVAVYNKDGKAWLIQADRSGTVHMLDARTGEERSTLDLGGPVDASPAVYNDYLLIGTCGKSNANMYCIKLK